MRHHTFRIHGVRAMLVLGLCCNVGGVEARADRDHLSCSHEPWAALAAHPSAPLPPVRAKQTIVETFQMTLMAAGESHPATFRRLSIRSPGFAVVLQNAGGFTSHAAGEIATYLGTLDDNPDALAAAVILPDGTVFYQVAFTDGEHWINNGGQTQVRNENPTFYFPNYVAPPASTASGLLKRVDVGIDMPNHVFNEVHGGNAERALRIVEYSLLAGDLLYIRQAGIQHRLGRLVIRGSLAQDPYAPLRPDDPNCGVGSHCKFFDEVQNQWNNVLPSGTEHMVMVLRETGGGSGIANLGVIGTGVIGEDSQRAYSSNDMDATGDFSIVWRHEAGHSWSVNHWDGGPPNDGPEGGTANSNNVLAKFSGSEVALIAAMRDSRDAALADIGPMVLPVPPHAATDIHLVPASESAVDIPVLANDHDANGEGLQLLSVRRVEGALDGQASVSGNVIRYVRQTQATAGFDVFEYTVGNTDNTRTARGLLFVSHVNFGTRYRQDFDAFPDGTTDLGDGSIISLLREDFIGATVQGGALEMTTDQTSQRGAFTVPLLGLQRGFSARFMYNVAAAGTPADALAFNFGQRIPAEGSPRHHGFLRGVTIEFNTFARPGFRLVINGVEVAYVEDADIANGQWQDVAIDWAADRVSLRVDGALKFDRVATDGFIPSPQDGVGFSAQTGGLSQRTLIDDIDVATTSVFEDGFETRSPTVP